MATKDLSVHGKMIVYSFQDEMWQVQRRKNFRYEFLAHDLKNKKKQIQPFAKILLNGSAKKYSLADLSASGIRVILSPEESSFWKKDDKIETIELTINGHVIKSKGVIRWARKTEAGIEFTDIAPGTQKWIHEQIVGELNDYFKSFPMHL